MLIFLFWTFKKNQVGFLQGQIIFILDFSKM